MYNKASDSVISEASEGQDQTVAYLISLDPNRLRFIRHENHSILWGYEDWHNSISFDSWHR